jgi:pantetheine-phosphate adenylyltransferase
MNNSMTRGIFAGSFNPFHIGHKYVANVASKLVDELLIVIAVNPEKTPPTQLDVAIRSNWILESVKHISPNIKVTYTEGLLVDFCQQNGITIMFRGIRNTLDFENELILSESNRIIDPTIRTIFIPTPSELSGISSSLIRTMVQNGKDIKGLVHQPLEIPISKFYKK